MSRAQQVERLLWMMQQAAYFLPSPYDFDSSVGKYINVPETWGWPAVSDPEPTPPLTATQKYLMWQRARAKRP